MGFLQLLEGIRTPLLTKAMLLLTNLGTMHFFVGVAIILLWCVDKRRAYYVLAIGVLGSTVTQWLKLVFRIPRPWVVDSDFTIVEDAREAATGYSFPSGHTQNAVGTLGGVAATTNRTWLRVLCLLPMALVPFSRMYLGVHTPLDVGVGFVIAIALVGALWPFFHDEEAFRSRVWIVFACMLAASVAFLAWVNMNGFPQDVDAENLAEGVKDAWLTVGSTAGIIVCYVVDRLWLDFDTKAPLPGQLLKLLIGLPLVLGLLAGLKAALAALTGGAIWAYAIRYFLAMLFAGIVWPLTFPFFARIGAKDDGGGAPAPESEAAARPQHMRSRPATQNKA